MSQLLVSLLIWSPLLLTIGVCQYFYFGHALKTTQHPFWIMWGEALLVGIVALIGFRQFVMVEVFLEPILIASIIAGIGDLSPYWLARIRARRVMREPPVLALTLLDGRYEPEDPPYIGGPLYALPTYQYPPEPMKSYCSPESYRAGRIVDRKI